MSAAVPVSTEGSKAGPRRPCPPYNCPPLRLSTRSPRPVSLTVRRHGQPSCLDNVSSSPVLGNWQPADFWCLLFWFESRYRNSTFSNIRRSCLGDERWIFTQECGDLGRGPAPDSPGMPVFPGPIAPYVAGQASFTPSLLHWPSKRHGPTRRGVSQGNERVTAYRYGVTDESFPERSNHLEY